MDNLNQKKLSNNERRNSKWTAEMEEQKEKGKSKCFFLDEGFFVCMLLLPASEFIQDGTSG